MQIGAGATGKAGAVIKNSYRLLSTDSVLGGFTCTVFLGLHGNPKVHAVRISVLQTRKLRLRKVKSPA